MMAWLKAHKPPDKLECSATDQAADKLSKKAAQLAPSNMHPYLIGVNKIATKTKISFNNVTTIAIDGDREGPPP